MLTAHLDRTTVRAAIALANRAPSVHNSQPWSWRIGPSSIHLFTDPGRALPTTDPEGRDLRISCGAALHHLRVALRAAGLHSRVHLLPNPARPDHLAAVEVFPAAPSPDDLALAAAIEGRHSDRRIYSTWPVPPVLLAEVVQAASDEGASLTVLDRESERLAVARLVERALVEQTLISGLAEETAIWSGRSRAAEDGVPAVNVPTHREGLVPVRRFARGEQAQNELGAGESDGTVLALLATRDDGPLDHVRAGEALSAALLTATRMGLATDPISQPLEVTATRGELRELCLAGLGHPQLLLRLGWAPISAVPVPATGRRPVDETIKDLEQPWT